MGLLSALYSSALACRSFIYANFKRPRRLPAKVVSVGNLTLGGTGKTPAVIAIAQEAKKRGLMPCILTRGYKGKSKGPCFVKLAGAGPCACPGQPQGVAPAKKGQGIDSEYICTDAGDEPVLMAERLKDVPIVKCADRYKGGQFALNSLPVTRHPSLLFILDDGFQHWNLHRDIDILLLDASNPFGNEKLFPEGSLREPLRSMRRAHVIVLTRADTVSDKTIAELTRKIKQYNPDAPVFTASHKPASLVNASGETKNYGMLKNNKVYAFAGIANPSYFSNMLVSRGAKVVSLASFRDHHLYKQRDIDKIEAEAKDSDIITTEKDLVKLKGLRLPENLFALRIEFEIEDRFYDIIFGNK